MRRETADHFQKWHDRTIVIALAIVVLGALSIVPCAAGAEKITDAAAGQGLSVALADTGEVWTWGKALDGALGINSSNDTATPQRVNLSHITDIAAGASHVLALADNGTVWAWGSNSYGQLGDGTTADRYLPVRVKGLDHVKAVAAGLLYSVALKDDGTVWAWGHDNMGQLGDGSAGGYEPEPVRVNGLSNVVRVYAGYNHNVAIDGNGNVFAWGSNFCGEIGDGTTADRPVPAKPEGLAGIRDVAPGSSYTIALYDDGTVRAWGENYRGWLGDGTADTPRLSPVTVKGLDHVKAIATGEGISFAIRDDGTVMAWGMNSGGLIGNGHSDQKVYSPEKIGGLDDISYLSIGATHVMGITSDGSLWAWGDNQFGEMGTGAADYRTHVPARVPIGGEGTQTPGQPTKPAGDDGSAATGTPAAVSPEPSGDGGRYVLMGAVLVLCLAGAVGVIVWRSRK